MTSAKTHHRAARALMLQHLDLHPGRTVNNDLDPLEAGIVGDTDHAAGGDSYHLGKDQIRDRAGRNRYSVDESARDQRGLDDNASAVDYGYFSVSSRGRTWDLYDYNAWLIGLCKAGDPDTADLREVIYSPDGRTVKRWDDLGVRSSGDSSHRTHTHHSEYRDATGVRMLRLATRWLQHIGLIPTEDDMPTAKEVATEVVKLLDGAPLRNGRTLGGTLDALAQADAEQRTVKGVWLREMGDPEKPPVDGKAQNSTAGYFLRFGFARLGQILNRLDLIMAKVGATGDELAAFNARERDEVPASPDENAQAVIARLAQTGTDELEEVLRRGMTPEARRDLAARLGADA